MSETVLVTGGTGFVAVWCIVDLLNRGFTVRTTIRDRAKEAGVRSAVQAGLRQSARPGFVAAPSSGAVGAGGVASAVGAVGAGEVASAAGVAGVAGRAGVAGEAGVADRAGVADGVGERLRVTGRRRDDGTERELGGAADERLSVWVADLGRGSGWDEAVAGCDYVLHVASPLGGGAERDAEVLIDAAREGTRRVLRAAIGAGVKRVVMTSSTAACTPRAAAENVVGDETMWTDPGDPGVNAYRRSKILAERAAWDLLAGGAGRTTLATVLPGAVFGPVATTANLGSVALIKRMLDGRLPGTPRVGFCVVDVRDLADLHIRAMLSPAAAGQRFIGAGDYMWMREIADTLRRELGDRAAGVPTRTLPDLLVRALALAAPDLRSITPLLGRKRLFSHAKAGEILGFAPRPATTTVLDCAKSLLPG